MLRFCYLFPVIIPRTEEEFRKEQKDRTDAKEARDKVSVDTKAAEEAAEAITLEGWIAS